MRPPESGAQHAAPTLVALGAIFAPFAAIGPNKELAFACLVVLILGGGLLLRPATTPALFFVFFYQWLQTSISVFASNLNDIEVERFADYDGDVRTAIVLSLIAILALATGMAVSRGREYPAAPARRLAAAKPLRQWFALYLAALAVATAAQAFAWGAPGLAQLLLAIAGLKWAFFFMLAYAALPRTAGGGAYFATAFAIEFALGFGGYFSDFKTVIILTLFAAYASGVRVSARSWIGMGAAVALLIGLGIVWSAIKTDYRKFLSGGQRAQIVTTSYADNVGKMVELTERLDARALANARTKILRRLSYVEFFGVVLRNVPSRLDFEGGALWADAIVRPFTPRLLFPQKEVIDDSARTRKYTGMDVAGAMQGTSISIGYVAEAYIDFGPVVMMAPIFALGLFYGRIYRWLTWSRRSRGPLGIGLAAATLYGPAPLETSITKSFGSDVVLVFVCWLIARYVAPRYFPWTVEPATPPQRPGAADIAGLPA